MLPYLGDLSVDNLHVQAPSEVVFVCGGAWSTDSRQPIASMRDAFLRVSEHRSLRGRDIILAEHVTRLSAFSAYYDELLEFENDLAQVTELILLFCESEGSFAELGSFAMIPEIASRVLVIIRDYHWKDDSFIKLGPLLYLIKKYSEFSVFVIEDKVMGMPGSTISGIKIDDFRKAIDEPLKQRLSRLREPSTFDEAKSGHIIKLIVGIVQEYGALTLEELKHVLSTLGLSISDRSTGAYLLCAEAVGWIEKRNKGFKEYLISRGGQDAALFVAPEDAEVKDRKRRRTLIREHWEKNDPARLRAILEGVGEEL